MNGFNTPELSPAERADRDAHIRDIVRINESKLNAANKRIADLEREAIQRDAQLGLMELLKDKDRLDWLLNEYGVRWDIINDDRVTREGIDKEMTDSGYKNMRDYNVNN
jgi:hypothetical protein